MKHINKRVRLGAIAAVIAAVALGLAGCSSGGGPGTATGSSSPPVLATSGNIHDLPASVKVLLTKGGNVTIWSWDWTNAFLAMKGSGTESFDQEFPKLHVNIVDAGQQQAEYTKLQNTLKAGSGAPDIAQIEYYALPQFILSKGIVPFTDTDAVNYIRGQVKQEALDAVSENGQLYAVPQDWDPSALYYNQAIFTKYGLTVPKTWSEYIADAKKLKTENPSICFAADNGDASNMTMMLQQAGAHPFQVDGDKITINMSDPGTLKYANMYNQLVENKLTCPQYTQFTTDWTTALGKGAIATVVGGQFFSTVLGGNGSIGTSASSGAGITKGGAAYDGDWRVAPMPTYGGGTPTTGMDGGSSWAVTSQSKNAKLAEAAATAINLWFGQIQLDVASLAYDYSNTPAGYYLDPEYNVPFKTFGGQKVLDLTVNMINKQTVPSAWQYLPYQVYANSIGPDTLGQAFAKGTSLIPALDAWGKALTTYGEAQGFTVKNITRGP